MLVGEREVLVLESLIYPCVSGYKPSGHQLIAHVCLSNKAFQSSKRHRSYPHQFCSLRRQWSHMQNKVKENEASQESLKWLSAR